MSQAKSTRIFYVKPKWCIHQVRFTLKVLFNGSLRRNSCSSCTYKSAYNLVDAPLSYECFVFGYRNFEKPLQTQEPILPTVSAKSPPHSSRVCALANNERLKNCLNSQNVSEGD